MTEAFAYPFAPSLAGSGIEYPAATGVPHWSGIALRPVPMSVAQAARAAFGRGAVVLVDEEEAAARVVARIGTSAIRPIRQRAEALAMDIRQAAELADEARRLARKPSDDAPEAIADMVTDFFDAVIARHQERLPLAVERCLALRRLEAASAPLAYHPEVAAALAELRQLLDTLDRGMAELRACRASVVQAQLQAQERRLDTISGLRAELAKFQTKACVAADLARELAATQEIVARLTARLEALRGERGEHVAHVA